MHFVDIGSNIISFKHLLNRTVPYQHGIETFTLDDHLTQAVRDCIACPALPYLESRDYDCHTYYRYSWFFTKTSLLDLTLDDPPYFRVVSHDARYPVNSKRLNIEGPTLFQAVSHTASPIVKPVQLTYSHYTLIFT